MKSFYSVIGLILTSAFLFSGCGDKKTASPVSSPKRLKIVTTFLPVYCFAANVAGDLALVENLLPPGVGPHDYQFSPRDLRELNNADLIFINGLGADDWLLSALAHETSRKTVVPISKGLESDLILDRSVSSNAVPNPHFWMNPKLAAHAVTNILVALQKADPANALKYKSNAENFVARLEKLDGEIANALSTVKEKSFITYHDAFPYFVRRYELNLIGVVELVPDVTPSPKYLSGLLATARSKNVKVLFTEPQFSSNLMTQIASDLKVPVGELDPLETGPFTLDAYENGMRTNLGVLQKYLK